MVQCPCFMMKPNKYVAASYVEARRREFVRLTQEDRTIAEYEAEFFRLSRFARGLVVIDYDKNIGSTHSYMASYISINLGIPVESTSGELVEHQASLDCTTKRVTLRSKDDMKIIRIEECQDYLSNVIFNLVAEKEVEFGIESFVVDILTIREFSNAFPEKLLGMPSDREVEFGIEILSGTTQMSIAPYHMASKEIIEFKAQLKELLD
ncbi:uncharacterized protein [Gossypium hirsutum]|uniref:Retrotransposon gag domain-containing protein n=1 Tax=Gossypium hirsutum TaxID=3635 RepID=A0A1U8KH91_GOSHI|nr:uncharacterized protein LOC107915430 [Gossypium hirsutum]